MTSRAWNRSEHPIRYQEKHESADQKDGADNQASPNNGAAAATSSRLCGTRTERAPAMSAMQPLALVALDHPARTAAVRTQGLDRHMEKVCVCSLAVSSQS